jgi:hypothetical protein
MLQWALRYAKIGMYVFPLKTSGDLKRPHGCLGDENGGHLKATLDEATIRAWWRRHPTAGIGVNLAASGLIAIDVDTREGGEAKLAKLERLHGALRSPVRAITGGGGSHILFAAPEGIRPPGKVGGEKGLDLKYNGYIVVAPSPHCAGKPPTPTGKTYKWASGADPFDNLTLVPLVPEWVLVRTPGKSVAVAGRPDDDDPFSGDSPKAGLSLDQISDMLDLVDNSGPGLSYDDWLNVLAGIWHETDGSAEGESLAREWSYLSAKHDEEKFARSWRSLNHEGTGRPPMTIRFLIKLASAAKAEASGAALAEIESELDTVFSVSELRKICERIRTLELDTLDRGRIRAMVQKVYKTVTGVPLAAVEAKKLTRFEDQNERKMPEWMKRYTFIAVEDKLIREGSRHGITRQAFDALHNKHMLTFDQIRDGVGFPDVTASHAALNLHNIPRADRRMYKPNEDRIFYFNGDMCFNTFSTESQPPIPDRYSKRDLTCIAILETHFAHLVPDDRERAIFISWLAWIVQTQTRPNWAVVIQSPEGEGKTFFANLMGAILGAENVQVLDTAVLRGDFTGWAQGDLLKVVEEIKLHGSSRYDVLDKMKAYVTNEAITVHPKGQEPFTCANTAGYLMFTNHRDALPLHANDTRYFMLASPRQHKTEVDAFLAENPSYFDNLFQIIGDAPGALRKWFLQYALHPEFHASRRAPKSAEREYVAKLGKSETEERIQDILAEQRHPALSAELMSATLLAEHLMRDDGECPRTNVMAGLLTKLGFRYLDRVRLAARNERFWSKKPSLFKTTSPKELARRIRDHIKDRMTEGL